MTKDAKERLVRKVLGSLTDEERQQLLEWAIGARSIQSNHTLTVRQRYDHLKRLELKPVVRSVFLRLGRAMKTQAWDVSSWPVRLGFGGATIGATAFAGKSVGIASFGLGIGVSMAVVLGLGGTFLGLVISHLEKE